MALSVLDTVQEILMRKGGTGKIAHDTDVFGRNILDSFGIIEVIEELEEVYNLSLSADDLVPQNFATPQAIADMIERVLAR